jgi:hypothetical protein
VATQIETDATALLLHMGAYKGDEPEPGPGQYEFSGSELAEATGLEPNRVNDAIEFLEMNGYAEARKYLGTAPYTFGRVGLTTFGRYEYQRLTSETETPEDQVEEVSAAPQRHVPRQPTPVGSPFGFTELDWEFVEGERSKSEILRVVFGYQFNSSSYDTEQLMAHVRDHFNEAVAAYNGLKGHENIALNFVPLRAGYGEHLFNEIARDIIAADIAVFETSDFNPNVMIEMGVALTWGVRVLPVKETSKPRPPSDISGQTWASYQNSGLTFTDASFKDNLVRMIERVMRRKAAG